MFSEVNWGAVLFAVCGSVVATIIMNILFEKKKIPEDEQQHGHVAAHQNNKLLQVSPSEISTLIDRVSSDRPLSKKAKLHVWAESPQTVGSDAIFRLAFIASSLSGPAIKQFFDLIITNDIPSKLLLLLSHPQLTEPFADRQEAVLLLFYFAAIKEVSEPEYVGTGILPSLREANAVTSLAPFLKSAKEDVQAITESLLQLLCHQSSKAKAQLERAGVSLTKKSSVR